MPFGNVPEGLRRIETVVHGILAEKRKVFAIGGEHLVTMPVVKAYKAYYPDLAVIQLDAHADLRDDYLGERLSHATVMSHVVEIVGPGNVYQLGIRSAAREEIPYTKNTNFYFNQLIDAGEEVISKIGEKPVYITLDIDVLDPAFAPGTGTPEGGGFSSRELLETLLKFKRLQVVGFDLVEISPVYEKGDNTSILGAKILREAIIAY
jgi:agmatinase